MLDREAVSVGQTGGDEGAVAGLGIALDAEERGEAVGGQCSDEPGEVDAVEDLGRVAPDVLGRELDARALADAEAGVLGVLELAQLGRRGELGVVAVADRRGGEGVLEAPGVGPRVCGPRTPRRWRTSRTRRTSAADSRSRNESPANP